MRTCIICDDEFNCIEALYIHAVMEHDDKQEATLNMKHLYVNEATHARLSTQQAQPWGLSYEPVHIPELVSVFGAQDEACKSYGFDNVDLDAQFEPVQPGYSYSGWLSAALNNTQSRTPALRTGGKIENLYDMTQQNCASQVIAQLAGEQLWEEADAIA